MHSRTAALGPFVLDRERQVVTCSGQPLPLGHRGYVLLETLIEAAGEPVSKQRLMDRAWPGIVVEEGNLSVQIAALRKQLGAHGGMLIVTVPRVGYRLITRTAEPCRAGPPLLAVLPFANRGSEDGYFADGVVEDIITALSRFRTFAVLARGSAFALHESNEDLPSATLGAGARYALGGSIQRRGDRLKVTARLSDLANGVQLWADSYEGAVAEVFSFQDRITESVVGVIEPTIRSAEIQRARRKPAASLDAYDLLLKSLPLVHGAAPDRWEEALELLRQSAALDPAFALPRAYAAWIYEKQISMRLPLSDDSHRETCVELARAALSLGGDDPRIRAICGWVLYRVAKDIAALQGLRQAAEDSPNDAVIQVLAGAGTRSMGRLTTSTDATREPIS